MNHIRSLLTNRVCRKILALAVSTSLLGFQQPRLFSAEHTYHGIEVAAMDTSVKPCQDFFQYANGTWISKNPIPPDQSRWGAFNALIDHNLEVLHQLLDELARDTTAPRDGIRWKVGEFYRCGMDIAMIEASGIKPLSREFARIDALADKNGLQELLAHFHRCGMYPGFAFGVAQDAKNSTQNIPQFVQAGIGLPDRDYYLKDDEKSADIRKAYLAYMTKMFQLLGESADAAAAHAQTVMAMETKLAKSSMTRVQRRDPNAVYHKMDLAGLSALSSSIDWRRYFSDIGLPEPGGFNVGQPDFFKTLGEMVETTPLADWKTYLRWHLIDATAPDLSSAFDEEHFNFHGKILTGAKEQKPRWKRMVEATDGSLGFALGQIYVEKAFPPSAKARMIELVGNLRIVLRERISNLEWMGDATRAQALHKLDAIGVKIGYPDKWRDYSKLAVDQHSYVLNDLQANEFEFQRELDKVGKPVDRTEWGMTPPTVNAYYNPTMNEIVFPAGILQPPFFDALADDASNYGAIGAVIGHEMTHGFDDSGRQFDADGNLKNWWTDEDVKAFNSRAEVVVNQFNDYVPLENLHINGKLTLGENIADLGGVRIAYMAFQKALAGKPRPEPIEGLSPEQRFFLAYAQVWRGSIRPEAARLRLNTDPHSPARQRVIGPLSNMPEFARAFNCADSDSFLRPENLRVRIW